MVALLRVFEHFTICVISNKHLFIHSHSFKSTLFTSLGYLLGKGGYVFGSVGLFVCLSVCLWTTLLKKL